LKPRAFLLFHSRHQYPSVTPFPGSGSPD